jgi:hypothetical protein
VPDGDVHVLRVERLVLADDLQVQLFLEGRRSKGATSAHTATFAGEALGVGKRLVCGVKGLAHLPARD